jgi:hypothetical protein
MILSGAPFVVYLLIALVSSLTSHQPFSEAFTGAKILYLPFLFALSMYAFFFIHYCFSMLSSSRFWIISFFLDSHTLERLDASLTLAFRPGLQFAVSTFTTLLVAIGAVQMVAPTDALEWWITLWWMWVMGFLVGNGFYWSLLVPQVANFFLFAEEVEYDELSPANTPGLRCIASIVGMAAVFDSVVVTSILYVLADPHFPHPAYPATRIFFLVYLAVGIPSLLYAFFYPLVSLSRLIIKLKRKTEYALLRMRLDSGLSFYKEQQLRTLLKEVRTSPDVPHAVHLVGRLFIALVFPVGALLIQLLVLRHEPTT